MLHLKTIDDSTLALLKGLMMTPCLMKYRLVGGTGLALQMGHRKSIDIDLFGITPFDEMKLHDELQQFGDVKVLLNTKFIKTYLVQSIKVDFVNYTYPWIDHLVVQDDIRMATPKEIAAMKMNAITNRGTKKDFYDLYELLNLFSLKQMIEFYKEKYQDGTLFMVLKSLTYFGDAENNTDPDVLKPITWEQVKSSILHAHAEYLKGL